MRSADTGTRLGLALLGYMTVVTLIITLLPFQFAWPETLRVMYAGDVLDGVANVLLFVPLGFLYRFATRGAQQRSTLAVLGMGALASVAVESAQLFEIARNASPLDVATNALGAWLGALACDRVAAYAGTRGQVIGWLSLELPLMGLVYLLVPLLWVDSLASGGVGLRIGMTLLLGLFAALLLGGMQRHYFGPSRASEPHQTAAFTAMLFVAGAFPLLPSRPLELILGAAGAGIVCWWQGRRRARETAPNRRFEVPLLESAAPVYALYLALAVAAPLFDGTAAWSAGVGFPAIVAERIGILRLLELVAGFTLAGYMVAEFRGRAVTAYRQAFPRLLRWGVGLALVTEFTRGYHAGQGASLARGVLLGAAALYGGWLYYLQRAHVVHLLSPGPRKRGGSSETMAMR